MPRSAPVAFILAGGRGQRLGELTDTTPKPLLPVAGKPFIEWTLTSLSNIGVSRVVVAAGYLADAIESHFRAPRGDGLVVTVVTEAVPLGTGGSLAFAAQSVPDADPMLVANGDSLIAGDLSAVWESLDTDIDGVIVAMRVADSTRFGRLQIAANGLLTGIGENEVGTGWVNAGIYLLRRRILTRFPEHLPLSLERDVIPALIATGTRLRVLCLEGTFVDIGLKESLRAAESFVSSYLDKGARVDHQ